MRRIKNLFLMIAFIFVIGITLNVQADGFEYYITNSNNYEPINNNDSKNIKRGDTIVVTAMLFNGDSVTDYKISSGKLTIRWDNKYVSLQEVNGKYYNNSISDITGLTIGSVNKSDSKITIGEISSTGTLKDKLNKLVEFKFKVLENAPGGETKIYQMDGEDKLECTTEETKVSCGESSYSELKYNITKSAVNKLTSIIINGQELEYFNEDKNDYDIEVDSTVEKVNIEVVKKDSKSTISGNYGNNEIQYGENKLVVNVISESGVKNTYHINITREDLRSNDNTLKTLTLSSGELVFNPNTLDYTINVENEVDKITITSSLNNAKAKYVTDYRNKEIELVEGSNKVEIKVVSEKGIERVYTLNINRALSSNNSLKTLKINDEKVALKDDEFIYNYIVENDVEEVVINAEANDPKATIDLNDKYPLQVGDNEINITVTAASGAKASYTLNINRKKLLSKDSLLTSLKIKGYSLDFKQDVKTYYLKIKDKDEQLEITTTQEDPNATVEIEGNKDLIDGSIIKINVKAEDGSFTRYFINIEKGSSGISPIIIVIIVLLLLLGLCIGLIIYRKKKKEKEKFDKLDVKEEKPVINSESSDEEEIPVEENINEEDVPSDISVENSYIEHGRHEKIPEMGSAIQFTDSEQEFNENYQDEDIDEQNKDVE